MLMLSMELRLRRWRWDWGTSAYPAADGSLHGRLSVWCWVAAYAGSSVRVQARRILGRDRSIHVPGSHFGARWGASAAPQWGPGSEGSQDPGHPSQGSCRGVCQSLLQRARMCGETAPLCGTLHPSHGRACPCACGCASSLSTVPPAPCAHPAPTPCAPCAHLRTPAGPRGSRAPGAGAATAAAWRRADSVGAACPGTGRGLNPHGAGGWSQ